MRSTHAAALLLPAVLALAACGSDSGASGGSGESVAVRAGDTACEVARTELTAGKTRFAVANTGSKTTEVYLYGQGDGGAYDKVVGEVENIAPGLSRDLSVTLGGGSYEVACKPGQTGDGIRTRVTVGGAPAASGAAAYDRELEVTATDFAFTGFSGFQAKVGERIEFKLENKGAVQHELEILGPDGSNLGEVGPTDPGKDGEVVVTLPVAGTYTYADGIDDHEQRGMKGSFTVG
jgi:uncharacterized cupredoxin-like copper-binding protein